MSNRTLPLNDGLYQYLLNHSVQEPEILVALRQETASLPLRRCKSLRNRAN